MAAAALVLDDRTEARTMAHQALDEWLDHVEAEAAEKPTLLEISERFMETRLDLLAACFPAGGPPAGIFVLQPKSPFSLRPVRPRVGDADARTPADPPRC